MKSFIKLLLPALLLASCGTEGGSRLALDPQDSNDKTEVVSHGRIEIGEKLKNPYSCSNMEAALSALYPTRSDARIPVTDLYVRFLPKTAEDFSRLEDLGVVLFDHPLDCEILEDGDYYHDPSIPENELTWQYAIVPPDFDFPAGVRYEILDHCHIAEHDIVTRSGAEGIDWDAVEREAFRLTGNAGMLEEHPETRGGAAKPSGLLKEKNPETIDP